MGSYPYRFYQLTSRLDKTNNKDQFVNGYFNYKIHLQNEDIQNLFGPTKNQKNHHLETSNNLGVHLGNC